MDQEITVTVTRRFVQKPLMIAAMLALTFSAASCCWWRGGPAGDTRIPPRLDAARVLIITGEDYEGHDWRKTTPVLRALIEKDTRMQVEVLDDLDLLGGKDLDPYAAVILHFKNYDPQVPGRAGLDNLARFAKRGGGLVLVHFACGAFEEFKGDYEKLVGRVWFGPTPPAGEYQHDPHGRFTVSITNVAHPVTRGLEPFETVDELYTCLTGDTPIVVLAEAVSKRNGKSYPMAFVRDDDRRRVFHCVLGHDSDALSIEPVAELYRRATAWAAGLPPTPENPPARRAHGTRRSIEPTSAED
jgi:type 1 glutamine amidotransferase